MTVNMSLYNFWYAQGKSCARDGKPAQYTLNESQQRSYTTEDKNVASVAYANGYLAGLPEDVRCECVLSVRNGTICGLCRMRTTSQIGSVVIKNMLRK